MIRVNDAQIDDTAIIKEMQYHEAASHEAAKQQASEALVIAELLRQRAHALGMELSESERESGSFVDRLMEQDVSVPEASDEACRQYYRANPQKFRSSPLLAARHILLPAAPDDAEARSEAREQAEQLIAHLRATPGSFADLALQYSQCSSAKTGGQLGQLSKGQTVSEFERQVFAAGEGLIEAPIESRYGIHVVWIDHFEPGRDLPYEAVETRIRDYVNEKVRRKAIAQYLQLLVGQAELDGIDMSKSDSPLVQ